MSVESLAVVLHHSPAQGTDKVILIGIANHDGDGGSWPSVATLARYANVSPRNVQKAIGRLVETGQVRVHVQEGGGARTADHARPNRYEVLVRCPDECDRSFQHRVSPATGGGADDTPPGGADDRGGVAQTTPEPSLNHPGNTNEGTTPPGDVPGKVSKGWDPEAREIALAWWQWWQGDHPGTAPTTTPFPGVVAALTAVLKTGRFERGQIKDALVNVAKACGPVSKDSLIRGMQSRTPSGPRQIDARQMTSLEREMSTLGEVW